jgi:hypothetical protein
MTDFTFQVPVTLFEKADAPKGQKRRIGGVISTETPDRQGEIVLQKGLDFSEFIQSGWFNDNHSKETTDGKLGYPVSVKHFQKGEKLPNGSKAPSNAHWVEGYLLENWGPADKLWEFGKSLQDTGRSLGYSVEGRIHRRIGPKTVFKKSAKGDGGTWVGNTVAKASVRNVAVTDCPVNIETGLELLTKSLQESEEVEIELGDLEGRISTLEKALTMGPPSETAPEGPQTGEGAAAVHAKESLEQDKNKKGKKKEEEDDEDDKKKTKLDKSLTYEAATNWIRERRPNLTAGATGRLLHLIQALKAQGRL